MLPPSPDGLEWRGLVSDGEVNALHAEAFEHPPESTPWVERLERWSLGWVTARDEDVLVGFVNVVWDGGAHAFVLDTCVALRARGRGLGVALLAAAAAGSRAAGCAWLHVDFVDELSPFYLDAAGFRPTPAGLLAL